MARAQEEIASLVELELDSIVDDRMRLALGGYLVVPTVHFRDWEYSQNPTRFACWTVAILIPDRLAIVYSDSGHGPSSPWGLVEPGGRWFGMDSEWFSRLEDAFRCSGVWTGPPPTGYQVP